MERDATIAIFEIRGARSSPYIFFTREGILWGIFSFGLFGLALVRSSGALLTLSFVLLGFSIIIILFTHENASGIRLSKIIQQINLKTGASSLLVEVRNQTKSRRYQCSVSVTLIDCEQKLVSAHIPVLEKGAVHTVSIPLAWQKPGSKATGIKRLVLESRFPCGLTRSWYQLGASKFSNTNESMQVLAVPKPIMPPAAEAMRMARRHTLADTAQGELRPYQNQNPTRIAWIPSSRSPKLLVRDCASNDDDMRHHWDSTCDEIHTIPNIPKQANYVYALALANFRANHRFSITDPHGIEKFTWSNNSREAGLKDFLLSLVPDP